MCTIFKSEASPRARSRLWLPLAAVALLLAAGPAPLALAGTVTFKYMYINDDEEGGDGDWKVTADVSPGQQGVPLIENAEAGTGESLIINKDVHFQSFPFTVTLKVEEHDGGIGATWEHVGTQTLTINQTGNFHMRVKNNEGDVSIYFDVHNTGSSQQPLSEGSKPKVKKPGAIVFVKPYLTKVQSNEGTVQSLPALVAGKTFWLIGNNFGADKSKVVVQILKNGKPVKSFIADGIFTSNASSGGAQPYSGVLATAPSLAAGSYEVRVMVWGKGTSLSKSVFMKSEFVEAGALQAPGLQTQPGSQVTPQPPSSIKEGLQEVPRKPIPDPGPLKVLPRSSRARR